MAISNVLIVAIDSESTPAGEPICMTHNDSELKFALLGLFANGH
jgi:hypothetical protein